MGTWLVITSNEGQTCPRQENSYVLNFRYTARFRGDCPAYLAKQGMFKVEPQESKKGDKETKKEKKRERKEMLM